MKRLRKLLGFPFALLWDLATRIRNGLFDSDIFTSQKFDIPIIGVGNLSMGGTGKTPHIEYLIKVMLENNQMPGVMSRGYKRKTSGYIFASTQSTVKQIGDEPLQYKLKHQHIPVAVSESRVLGIPEFLMDAPELSVILLDDIYQHRAVQPGCLILITDYNHLYVDDMVFPSGNLRESQSGAKRANIIIVSKCPANLTLEQSKEIEKRLSPKPHQTIYFSTFEYGKFYHFIHPEKTINTNELEVIAATGIAKPEYFITHLQQQFKAVYPLNYSDHHSYTERDIYDMERMLNNLGEGNQAIFVTEKDAVKLREFSTLIQELNLPIIVQPIAVKILFEKEEKLNQQLLNFVKTYQYADNA